MELHVADLLLLIPPTCSLFTVAEFSCFCSLLTPMNQPVRGFQRYPHLALRATVRQDKDFLPTAVSGNICLQVPECFAFQPSCTRADTNLQYLAAILTSLNGATSRGSTVTVILMSKHPGGGFCPPLLASCLSPHQSALPSGGSPEMLCLPAGLSF